VKAMPLQEDSDVKIFEKKGDPSDANDLLETAAFLNRQRSNGNIARAKSLGEELAMLDPENNIGLRFTNLPADESKAPHAISHQARALVVFLAQTALHIKLRTQLLSSCAVNAMYDKIMKTSPDFYNGLCDGAAFTLYSLSLKDEDTGASIGEHFAMLCGMEGIKEYITFGVNLYKEAIGVIEQILNEYKFEKID
jgi:hypothetical protein